jgi:glycosyltransferase involved in cell wall biosynthesis
MLRNAYTLARLITRHEWAGLGKISVVIGLRREAPYDWVSVESRIRDCGVAVSLRRMEWTAWGVETVRCMFPSLNQIPSVVDEVMLPRDYRHNFLDCDAWIVFGQSIEGYVAPVRPFAVYCADLIQRYVPQIFDSGDPVRHLHVWGRQTQTFLGWRAARCVFATTPQTRRDVISYAGVPSDRALLAPTLIDPLVGAGVAQHFEADQPHIVWVTNNSPHKNQAMAVNAARIYYDELGGDLSLTVVGSDSNLLDPRSGSASIGAVAFERTPGVTRRTDFAGEVSDAVYSRIVQNAAVVWHNVIVDNGTFVAFDAARYNRHMVSSDYPQMRYLCDHYGIVPIWHRADDPRAAAEALLLAEGRFKAGERPLHSLREDTEGERLAGYGAILQVLLSDAGA